MSKNTDAEKTRWDQVMENFDLLFTRVNDIGLIQQELKKENSEIRDAQRVISQQVQAIGQAVAALTLRQMENEAHSNHSDVLSLLSEEVPSFENVFGKTKDESRPGTSKKPP
jgi:two-component sensor histidine kinase